MDQLQLGEELINVDGSELVKPAPLSVPYDVQQNNEQIQGLPLLYSMSGDANHQMWNQDPLKELQLGQDATYSTNLNNQINQGEMVLPIIQNTNTMQPIQMAHPMEPLGIPSEEPKPNNLTGLPFGSPMIPFENNSQFTQQEFEHHRNSIPMNQPPINHYQGPETFQHSTPLQSSQPTYPGMRLTNSSSMPQLQHQIVYPMDEVRSNNHMVFGQMPPVPKQNLMPFPKASSSSFAGGSDSSSDISGTPVSMPAPEVLPKKNACHICHKQFQRPSSLQIHYYTHTGEKIYKCPHPNCGKLFSVKSNMTRHYRLHERGFKRFPKKNENS